MTSFHDFSHKTIDGAQQSLADYKGKVLLVVNVASRCGLTPHYAPPRRARAARLRRARLPVQSVRGPRAQ